VARRRVAVVLRRRSRKFHVHTWPGPLDPARTPLTQFLNSLETTEFSLWVRHSGSIWSYPTILLLHTYGMAILVGIVIAIDARILGFASSLPLAPMKKFFPLTWAAFWVNAVTGTILFVADASRKAPNIDFWAKMLFIALAVVNLRTIQRRVFREPDVDQGLVPSGARRLAALSMIYWLLAIVAGRLLAYVGSAREF